MTSRRKVKKKMHATATALGDPYPLFTEVLVEGAVPTRDPEQIEATLAAMEEVYPELHEEEGDEHEFIFDPDEIIGAKLDVDAWLDLLVHIASKKQPSPDKTEMRSDLTPEEAATFPLVPWSDDEDEDDEAPAEEMPL